MHEMPPFEFRLRVNLADCRIICDQKEIEIAALPNGERLRLHGNGDALIKDSDRIAIFGAPFSTEEAAQAAARDFRSRLLQWALKNRLGIDLGMVHKPTGVTTAAGLAHFEQMFGCPLRSDIHGIDTYERTPGLRFVDVCGKVEFGRAIAGFTAELRVPPKPTSKTQELAAEIFAASFFDRSPSSRFLSLMVAIESILEQSQRNAEAQLVVDSLQMTVEQSPLDTVTKESMKGAIKWIRKESIRQSGQRIATELLNSHLYDEMLPAKFFQHIYDKRCKLVHDGVAPPRILSLVNTTAEFAGDLIEASIDHGQLPSSGEGRG